MGDRIRERVGGKRAFLCALAITFCAGALLAQEAKVPDAWTSEAQQVKVATPKGEETKAITYYTNSIGVRLVLIPAGEFVMGSPAGEGGRDVTESPQHKVRITRPFFIGACELTQKQYQNIMGESTPRFEGASNPMEKANWNDAAAFCQMLSKREGVTYRLPTEAEWEYACRAGSATPFYFGATISPTQANYDTGAPYTPGDEDRMDLGIKTKPAGSYLPNALGLYDMAGNVYEWCQDLYADDYYAGSPAADPKGPEHGDYRVIRGGSWYNQPLQLRSAARQWAIPTSRYGMIGFRVVAEMPQ